MGLRSLGRLLGWWLLGRLLHRWRLRRVLWRPPWRLLRWRAHDLWIRRPHDRRRQSPFAADRRRLWVQGESSDSYRPNGHATFRDYHNRRCPRTDSGASRSRYRSASSALECAHGGSPGDEDGSARWSSCGTAATGRWHAGRRPALRPSDGAHSCAGADASARRRAPIDPCFGPSFRAEGRRHVDPCAAVFPAAVSQSCDGTSDCHTLSVTAGEFGRRPARHKGDSKGDSEDDSVDASHARAGTDDALGAVQNALDPFIATIARKREGGAVQGLQRAVSSIPRAQHEVGSVPRA